MKNKKLFLIPVAILGIALTAYAAGVPKRFGSSDEIILGRGTNSTDDRAFTFDTGDGASNRSIVVPDAGSEIQLNAQSAAVGDGTDVNTRIYTENGDGNRPYIGYDATNNRYVFANDGVTEVAVGSGGGGGGGIQLLENPDFEIDESTGWTNTGSSTLVAATGSSALYGDRSAVWDPTAASERLDSDAYDVLGLKGDQCMAQIYYLWDSGVAGDIDLQLYDETNAGVIAEAELLPTDGVVQSMFVVGTCPNGAATDEVRLRLVATTDAAAITLDRTHLGSNIRSVQVASAEQYGTLRYAPAASCSWTATGTFTNDEFVDDSDCSTPTVTGKVQAPATKIPALVVSGPGLFDVQIQFPHYNSTGNNNHFCRLIDEDDNVLNGSEFSQTAGTTFQERMLLRGTISYTSAEEHTIRVQCGTGGNTMLVEPSATERTVVAHVVRFPLDSEKAITLDAQGTVGVAEHEGDCSFETTSTSFVQSSDSTCTFTQSLNRGISIVSADDGADNESGIIFTPNRTGLHKITAFVSCNNGGTLNQALRLQDGSATELDQGNCEGGDGGRVGTLVGFVNVTSLAATAVDVFHEVSAGTGRIGADQSAGTPYAIRWVVENVEQSFPQPIIPNAVTVPNEGVGMKEIAFSVDFSSTTPTLDQTYGGGIDSIDDDGAGLGTVNWTAGFWSEPPVCVMSGEGAGNIRICSLRSDTTTSIMEFRGTDGVSPTDSIECSIRCLGK